MDFRSLLTRFPSGLEKELYIKAVGDSKEKFRSLLDLVIHDPDPVSWRAAWILDGSDEARPGLADSHISAIVQSLPELQSEGALRSLLRLLCRHRIPEKDQGSLIDCCFSYLISELYPVAVKVHAMQIIYNHVLIYPELKEELITVIEDQIVNNSVGFKSRGKRIMQQLEKI